MYKTINTLMLIIFVIFSIALIGCGNDEKSKTPDQTQAQVPQDIQIQRTIVDPETYEGAHGTYGNTLAYIDNDSITFRDNDGREVRQPLESIDNRMQIVLSDSKLTPGPAKTTVTFKKDPSYPLSDWKIDFERFNIHRKWYDKIDFIQFTQYSPHGFIGYRQDVWFAVSIDTLENGKPTKELYGFYDDDHILDTLDFQWTVIRKLDEGAAKSYIDAWPDEKKTIFYLSMDDNFNHSEYNEGVPERLINWKFFSYIVRLGTGTGPDPRTGFERWGWWELKDNQSVLPEAEDSPQQKRGGAGLEVSAGLDPINLNEPVYSIVIDFSGSEEDFHLIDPKLQEEFDSILDLIKKMPDPILVIEGFSDRNGNKGQTVRLWDPMTLTPEQMDSLGLRPVFDSKKYPSVKDI